MRISAEADYHNYIIQWIIVNEFHEKKSRKKLSDGLLGWFYSP